MTKFKVVRKNWEFQEIIQGRKQFVSKYAIIYYLPNDEFKVGISIPKAFANACLRNKYRNQIRQIIRKNDLSDIKMQSIIIIRKDFFNIDFIRKEKEIIKLYERIRNVKKN
ncbi:ribonuclease P protein component [Mycoplasma phocoenae]|uniref:Ribonuclease P protein component n=1 Tax=Mycoplasma phocoenae TaxID=754517 RepID=A0A858U426_9MOLU|nr:ribonuclease P protein component [Mycoplasma phocoenae]QJG67220.1 ribonuclease P protein component [Mycoplasma phocoenae]